MNTTDSTRRIYVDAITRKAKILRLLWRIVYLCFFYWTPNFGFNKWRLFLLRLFGAQIGKGCKVASSSHIWTPWNLSIGSYVCLGEHTEIYCVDKIKLGNHVTISQRSTLCSASHDINFLSRPLTHQPIQINDHSWICAEAFVGPGVTIGEGAVVGARAVVAKDIRAWDVVVGNPAKVIRKRIIQNEKQS